MSVEKPSWPRGAGWVAATLMVLAAFGAVAAAVGMLELGVFVSSIAVFHLVEFAAVFLWRREQLSMRSFAFNGLPYAVALGVGLLEHGIRAAARGPTWWEGEGLFTAGIALMLVGGLTRVWAMQTAGRHFNHCVQTEVGEAHGLVEAGPYRWLRHPSYFGFYWFSIGSQLVLANPVTLLLYAAALARFFAVRIPGEEVALEARFGAAYRWFRASRVLGLPGVRV